MIFIQVLLVVLAYPLLSEGQTSTCPASTSLVEESLTSHGQCMETGCSNFQPISVTISVQNAQMVRFEYVSESNVTTDEKIVGPGWVTVGSTSTSQVVKVLIVITWMAGSSQLYQDVQVVGCMPSTECCLTGCELDGCSCYCPDSGICKCPEIYLELKSVMECALIVITKINEVVKAMAVVIELVAAVIQAQVQVVKHAKRAACDVADITALSATAIDAFVEALAIRTDITLNDVGEIPCRCVSATELVLNDSTVRYEVVDGGFSAPLNVVSFPSDKSITSELSQSTLLVHLAKPHIILKISMQVEGVESVNFSAPGLTLLEVVKDSGQPSNVTFTFENCTLEQDFSLTFIKTAGFSVAAVSNLRIFICEKSCLATAGIGLHVWACARAEAAAFALSSASAQAKANAQAKAAASACAEAHAFASAAANFWAKASSRAFAAVWAVVEVDCNGLRVNQAAVATIKDIQVNAAVKAALDAQAVAEAIVTVAVELAVEAQAEAEAFAFAAAFASARATNQAQLVIDVLAAC